MNKDRKDTQDAPQGAPTAAGLVELEESQLDQVTGGGLRRPTVVSVSFDGVRGESTDKDHKGGA
jgi:hypothetical protein